MSEPASVAEVAWPAGEAAHAVDAMGRELRLVAADTPTPPAAVAGASLDVVIADSARRLALTADAWTLHETDVGPWLEAGPPGLLLLPEGEGLLAVVRSRGKRLIVLGRDRRLHQLHRARLVPENGAADAAGDDAAVTAIVDAGLTPPAAARAVAGVRRERGALQPWGTAWSIAGSPQRPLLMTAARRRLLRVGMGVVATAFAEGACLALAWWLLGRHALVGEVRAGWLTAFFLILMVSILVRALGRTAQGRLAYAFGAMLQRKLHLGALRLPAQTVKAEGTGLLLARVFESARLEGFGVAAGFAALAGAVQLPLAAWVLSQGPAPLAAPLALAAAAGAMAAATAVQLRRQRVWTHLRAEHTHALVELLLGHRTRLAQEPAGLRHREEDGQIARLLQAARSADEAALPLLVVVPRAFFVAGLLTQALAAAGPGELGRLAAGLGGVLLGYGALQAASFGARDFCTAVLAWRQVRALAEAADRGPREASDQVAALAAAGGGPVLEAREVSFTYPGRAEPALEAVSLTLQAGERVLVEGPSGAGKSTLAALLGGLSEPDRGAILLRGFDAGVWGEHWWRRQVVLAPQFHENHVFAASLAFNVLLARGWPPAPDDLAEAAEVCRELGLGPLLERMPGGLSQPVGETGWQLSHGERTRVFLARALLQRSPLVVLDESFAALDPATLRDALLCARRRASTLVVVAHP